MRAQQVKEIAYRFGADLCGFASMDRFEGAPLQMDLRHIFGVLTPDFPLYRVDFTLSVQGKAVLYSETPLKQTGCRPRQFMSGEDTK